MPTACRVILKRPKSVKYGFDANNQDQIAATSVRQGLYFVSIAMKKVVIPGLT